MRILSTQHENSKPSVFTKATIECISLLIYIFSYGNSQCTNNISCQYDAMFSSYCTYLFIYIYPKQNGTLTFVKQHIFYPKMWSAFCYVFDGTPFILHVVYYVLYLLIKKIYIWVDDEHLNNANHSTDHCFLFHLPFYADQTFK